MKWAMIDTINGEIYGIGDSPEEALAEARESTVDYDEMVASYPTVAMQISYEAAQAFDNSWTQPGIDYPQIAIDTTDVIRLWSELEIKKVFY
jgi:hypothetical protein